MTAVLIGSIVAILIGVFAVDQQADEANDYVQELRKVKYAVIFDAGSTGSRVHVFKFLRDLTTNDTYFHFSREYFLEVKPGLSYYASRPTEAANSLLPLLQFTEKHVPEEYIGQTSLQMMATAGLRLLPGDEADQIMLAVDAYLRSYKPSFQMDKDAVSIIDGTAEAIYGWFTINFLLNAIRSPAESSVAVFDLGGGSTQITFVPRNQSTLLQSEEHMVPTKVLGTNIKLYARSYLGYGLNSARKAILLSHLSTTLAEDKRDIQVESPCLLFNTTIKWTFEGKHYTVIGSNSSAKCDNLVRSFVRNGVKGLPELNHINIYGISFFYDRAADVGIIDEHSKSGKITVGDYLEAAHIICDTDRNTTVDSLQRNICQKSDVACKSEIIGQKANRSYGLNPFICLDLTYIGMLLTEGYGLQSDKEMTIAKKIHDVEASWALGAVLKYLDS